MKITGDDNINQSDLINWTKLKIKFIKFSHIQSVISLMLDEISKDLEKNKTLKIYNLGEIFYSPPVPKKIFNVVSQQVKFTPGRPKFKFKIYKKIRRKLLKMLDLDKTFEGGDNEDSPI